MSRQDRIRELLHRHLSPELLEIDDDSHLHHGHQQELEGQSETHFRLKIRSSSLTGKTRVQQHRQINALLASEFDSGLHALQITVL